MKTTSTYFVAMLLLMATFSAKGQRCPGSNVDIPFPAIYRFGSGNPSCGSDANFTIQLFVNAQGETSVDYSLNGPNCVVLPAGYQRISQTYSGKVSEYGNTYDVYNITMKPTLFTGGVITVKLGYNCTGNNWAYGAESTATLSRPGRGTASISGSSLICSGSFATFSVATFPGDNAFNWTTNSALTINNGQNTGAVNVSPNGSGSASVNVSFNDGCNNSITSPQYNLWTGTPQVVADSWRVNGQLAQSSNTIDANGGQLTISTVGTTGSAVRWEMDGGSDPNGQSCLAYTSGFLRVRAVSTNSCGDGTSYTFYLRRSGTYGYRLSSPTNSKDKLLITFEEKQEAKALLDYAVLLDDKSKEVSSFIKDKNNKNFFDDNSTVELDIAKLKKAVYFLHVKMGETVTKQQVLLD